MSPPKDACSIYAKVILARLEFLKKAQQIKDTVNAVLEILMNIKYGLPVITDIAKAELLSSVSSIASQAAQSLLGSVSNLAANLLNAILVPLLKILLANPTSLFSIVSMQQDRAIERTQMERRYLMRARSNLFIVMSIVRKWTSGIDGSKYLSQIQEAIPYLEKAISLSNDLLQGLSSGDGDDGEPKRVVFNESKYRQLRLAIRDAINITRPQSIISNMASINDITQSKSNELYNARAAKINATYKESRSELTKEYTNQMSKIDRSRESVKSSNEIERINNQYFSRKSIMENEYKNELERAKIASHAAAITSASTYIKAAGGLREQFSYDISQLLNNLRAFIDNIKHAYLNYIACRALCRSLCRSKELILKLMAQLIKIIGGIGGRAGDFVSRTIQASSSMVEIVHDDFTGVVNSHMSPNGDVGSASMAATIAKGNSLLIASESLLRGSVTDSLIQLINADNILEDASGRYDKWIDSIVAIPDWDGQRGVWAVKVIGVAQNPYPGMIFDSLGFLIKAPVDIVSKTEKGARRLRMKIRELNNSFNKIIRHNVLVFNVLTSYSGYRGSDSGNLTRLLAAAGLLEKFMIGLDIFAIIADISTIVTKFDFSNEMPTFENCKSAYPDLFTDSDMALVAVKELSSIPEPTAFNEYQAKLESGASSAENVMALRINIDSFSVDDSIENEDLINNSESPLV